MKAVLLSIRPKWCELIASGKKTAEVRKTKPKLDLPFKVYIYCTLPPQEELFTHGCIREYANELIRLQDGRIVYDYGMRLCCDPKGRPYTRDNFLCQKVIGEFVCDAIDEFTQAFFDEQEPRDTEQIGELLEKSCLYYDKLTSYVGLKRFYAWNISNLVIYDRPKSLGEFCKPCDPDPQCDCRYCMAHGRSPSRQISRSPQDWFYVEGLAPAGAG